MEAIEKKSLGAFYTDRLIAQFLTHWAILDGNDRVLDPACGDGVFIESAISRLNDLGTEQGSLVFGVDVNPKVFDDLSSIDLPDGRIIINDFFRVDPTDLGYFDAVVGNPPFIRYQKFNGSLRSDALSAASKAGVKLPKLSSSWAPFIVHSTSFLKPGGRLAMVIPTEINHASYALPVLDYLIKNFNWIRLIAFREPLFPELNQDTYCLLAHGFGKKCSSFKIVMTKSANEVDRTDIAKGTPVDINSVASGETRLINYLLSENARRLYQEIKRSENSIAFGEIADVGIGYVTGDNSFFHLTNDEVEKYEIPSQFLKPAVRFGRQLRGLRYTNEDWESQLAAGNKQWLLRINPDDVDLPNRVKRYLEIGKADLVHQSYKCRVRKSWYAVPGVYIGDSFISYMSGTSPSLVVNDMGVVAPNTLHVVRFNDPIPGLPERTALSWNTSLSMLSFEIEGHALGGGMLKLEPTEAESVVIVKPEYLIDYKHLYQKVDQVLRSGESEIALNTTDKEFLINSIGLSKDECNSLRDGAQVLRLWRNRRNSNSKTKHLS